MDNLEKREKLALEAILELKKLPPKPFYYN
jgi:hypothetical protein